MAAQPETMAPDRDTTGQAAFAAALLDPAAPAPSDLATIGGKVPSKRFAVYRNNVVVSLIAALGSAYPTVKKLVGEAFFDAMAGVYVRERPPRSPLMIHYGACFPDWIADFEPAQSVAYLADMARLERARRTAYHAADAQALGAEAFRNVPADALDGALIALHPSATVLRSPHPVFSIWRNVNGEVVDVQAGPEDVLVARPDDEVEMRALPPGAAAFLTALGRGATLAEASGEGAVDHSEFDLPQNIGGLIESRVMTRLETGG